MGDYTPDAMFTDNCVVTLERKGGSATTITTRVSNFNESGGGKDIEKADFFGNASLTVKKTRELLEIGFDTRTQDTDWAYIFGGTLTSAGSANKVTNDGEQTDYKIKLEWTDAVGSAGYKMIYYNAVGVTYEKEWATDDYLKGTLSFKLTPTSAAGSGQKYEIECYDFGDTTGSGSYVAWETTADSLFGY